MRKTKLAFAKVKKINGEINELFFSVEGALYSSIEGLSSYERMECAKKLFYVHENFVYNDVEIPTDEVNTDDLQTDEGQKKYWNWYITNLKRECENGDIIGYVPAQDGFNPDECQICYVFDIGGRELFLMDETTTHGSDIYELFEVENVTGEYYDKFIRTINLDEIKEFVSNHTQDEVEDKYAVKWMKERGSTDSMWEW